ncbi:MAG: 50S ribosomal protein L3 N(5)-glutamine methyltransferase [Halioglobus sp.]
MTNLDADIEAIETMGEAIEYCAQALTNADVYFGHGTDNAWDEAVQLVLSIAGLPAHSDRSVVALLIERSQLSELQVNLTRRIEENIPLPYLTGKAWFAGLEFRCDDRAIIPRSPIAELIRKEFSPWYAGPPLRTVLDLCCGGGCIGLASSHYLPDIKVDLADLDPSALELASENVAAMGMDDRVRVYQSDLFTALPDNRYDLILSNPPYVDSQDLRSMPAEYHREPELALGSGPDGLALTRKILASAGQYLQPSGILVLEVGNSWEALELAYPTVPFTWVEFEFGGHGVLILTAKELQEYSASFIQ